MTKTDRPAQTTDKTDKVLGDEAAAHFADAADPAPVLDDELSPAELEAIRTDRRRPAVDEPDPDPDDEDGTRLLVELVDRPDLVVEYLARRGVRLNLAQRRRLGLS